MLPDHFHGEVPAVVLDDVEQQYVLGEHIQLVNFGFQTFSIGIRSGPF